MQTKTKEIGLLFAKLKSRITPGKKRNSKNSFLIIYFTGYLMIALKNFYDDYIDRLELTEQKKLSLKFEPHTKVVSEQMF